MKTGMHQHASLQQTLKMNPRLYQAMDLLYMPLLDLQQHLKQELLSNPFLEMAEAEEESPLDATQVETKPEKNEESGDDEPDWENILLDDGAQGLAAPRDLSPAREYVEPVAPTTRDLSDHLQDQVQMLDLQYHDVRPDKGLYFLLERRGEVDRIISNEDIEAALSGPPSDTRAYFRGECIRRYPDAIFGVNWDSISFNVGDEPVKRILMNEPLKGTRGHVEQLLRDCEDAAALVDALTA